VRLAGLSAAMQDGRGCEGGQCKGRLTALLQQVSAALGQAPQQLPAPQQQQQQQLPAAQQQQAQQQQPPPSEPSQADCMACRLTGLMLGLGGCGYVSSRLWVEPYPRGGHRVALITASAALLGLGLSRAAGL